MSEQYCKICLISFADDDPQRKLSCDHSFCTSCITNLLETIKQCPTCDSRLTQIDAYQYQIVELDAEEKPQSNVECPVDDPHTEKITINPEVSQFPIIDLFHEPTDSNGLPDSPQTIKKARQLLEEFNKEHQDILTPAVAAISKALSHSDKVDAMKANETKLLQLISKKDEELKLKEVEEALDEMKHVMKEVSTLFLGKSCVERDFHITIKQFETSRDFLSKIYNEIHDGVKLVAFKIIEGEEKFAEISIKDTTMFVHAFGSTVQEFHSKVIEFEDLKEAFLERSLRVFFDFTSPTGMCQRVFIECYDHSVFTYFFLKLCTGEAGPSYLGCPLNRKSDVSGDAGCIVSVESFQTKLDYEDKYQERLCKNSEVFGCLEKKKQYFVSFLLSGSFEVIKCESDRMYPNVIGISDQEETHKLLNEKNYNKVLNCGIALPLNF